MAGRLLAVHLGANPGGEVHRRPHPGVHVGALGHEHRVGVPQLVGAQAQRPGGMLRDQLQALLRTSGPTRSSSGSTRSRRSPSVRSVRTAWEAKASARSSRTWGSSGSSSRQLVWSWSSDARDGGGHQPALQRAVVGDDEQRLGAVVEQGVLRVVDHALATTTDRQRGCVGAGEVDGPHLRGVGRDRPDDGEPAAAALPDPQLEARVVLLQQQLVRLRRRPQPVTPHLEGPVALVVDRVEEGVGATRSRRRRSSCAAPRRAGPRPWSRSRKRSR